MRPRVPGEGGRPPGLADVRGADGPAGPIAIKIILSCTKLK